MPIRLEVSEYEGVVRTTVSGPFQVSDVRHHLQRITHSRAYRLPCLVDARAVGDAKMSPRDLLSLAHLAHEALGSLAVAPCAIVVDSERHFARARMFAAFVAGWLPIGVFRDPDEAETWLMVRARRLAGAVRATGQRWLES